jgi:hypothetical protein
VGLGRVHHKVVCRTRGAVIGRVESCEVDAVAEEGEGGKTTDGAAPKARNRLPGEGLDGLVEE